jgi:hypothetical protein
MEKVSIWKWFRLALVNVVMVPLIILPAYLVFNLIFHLDLFEQLTGSLIVVCVISLIMGYFYYENELWAVYHSNVLQGIVHWWSVITMAILRAVGFTGLCVAVGFSLGTLIHYLIGIL